MTKFEMVKQLEYLIAFQSDCLQKGDWEVFDRLEDSIKKLERMILHPVADEMDDEKKFRKTLFVS